MLFKNKRGTGKVICMQARAIAYICKSLRTPTLDAASNLQRVDVSSMVAQHIVDLRAPTSGELQVFVPAAMPVHLGMHQTWKEWK